MVKICSFRLGNLLCRQKRLIIISFLLGWMFLFPNYAQNILKTAMDPFFMKMFTAEGIQAYDAQIVSNTNPDTMLAGQSYNVNITVKNTGTNTWTTANNYRLGPAGLTDPFAGTTRYPVSNAVAPVTIRLICHYMANGTDWRDLVWGYFD